MDTPRSVKPHRPKASTRWSASHQGWTTSRQEGEGGSGGRREGDEKTREQHEVGMGFVDSTARSGSAW